MILSWIQIASPGLELLYRGKFWGVQTLAELANCHKSTKVSSAKMPCLILNNIINFQICQSLCHQMYFVDNLPKFAAIKVSLYMVLLLSGCSPCTVSSNLPKEFRGLEAYNISGPFCVVRDYEYKTQSVCVACGKQ